MARADQVRLSYIKESTFGTTPSGSLQLLRFVGESLKRETTTTESPELGNRRTTDVVRSHVQGSGGFNSVLSFGNLDDWLEAMLAADATFPAEVVVTNTDISAANSDNSFNDATNSPFGSINVNDWIEASGFANAANNGFFKVVSATTSKVVVSGGTLVDESAGPSVTINQGGCLVDGSTRTSFSVEKEFQDVSNAFETFTGVVPGELSLAAERGGDGLITANFSLLTQDQDFPAATIGIGYIAATTSRLMNTIDHAKSLLEGLSAITSSGFSFTMRNNLSGEQNLGSLGNDDVNVGPISINGRVTQYFKTTALLSKYTGFTDSELAFVIDGDGGAYVIEFPAVNYTDVEILAGGRGQDVMAQLSFTAKEDSAESAMVRICRFAD